MRSSKDNFKLFINPCFIGEIDTDTLVGEFKGWFGKEFILFDLLDENVTGDLSLSREASKILLHMTFCHLDNREFLELSGLACMTPGKKLHRSVRFLLSDLLRSRRLGEWLSCS